jgi:hypothetical protein
MQITIGGGFLEKLNMTAVKHVKAPADKHLFRHSSPPGFTAMDHSPYFILSRGAEIELPARRLACRTGKRLEGMVVSDH